MVWLAVWRLAYGWGRFGRIWVHLTIWRQVKSKPWFIFNRAESDREDKKTTKSTQSSKGTYSFNFENFNMHKLHAFESDRREKKVAGHFDKTSWYSEHLVTLHQGLTHIGSIESCDTETLLSRLRQETLQGSDQI